MLSPHDGWCRCILGTGAGAVGLSTRLVWSVHDQEAQRCSRCGVGGWALCGWRGLRTFWAKQMSEHGWSMCWSPCGVCGWHFIFTNAIGGKAEDFRYAQWRREWKHFYLRSFLQVFMLQGLFLLIIAWPVMFINLAAPGAWHVWDVAGTVVWLIGFGFESIGDYQLAQFKKNPAHRGKLITTGLWRYTRHPNYFGEAVLWWGIFMIACAVSGWITVVGPLLITYLLRYVSGVPMLERKYANHPDFEEYKRKTSVFFPLPRVLR
jgi:steroid 5-alpha reductase family enzyme